MRAAPPITWPTLTAAVIILIIPIISIGTPASGQTPFVFDEVSAERGIEHYHMAMGMGGGVAAADFDGDGDIDVFVPNAKNFPDQLYRNRGDGFFEEVAAEHGLASTARSRVALWLDYDGDGDLDLLVATDQELTAAGPYTLYRQEPGGRFTDATRAAKLIVPTPPRVDRPIVPHRGGLCAGDINQDGHLDLFSSHWNGLPHLFLSNGDGTFQDITQAAGVDTALHYGHQPMMADFDGDGWTDIYAAIDFLWNALWINKHDHTFADVAARAHADNAMNDMGLSLGDYDNDGDLDVYVTNITAPGGHNILLRNETAGGVPSFVETSMPLGVDDGGWGWGVTFLDADNDGWLDVAATNGWWTPMFIDDTSRLFWNRLGTAPPGETVPFVDVSAVTRFDDSEYGSCLIAFDADRDGDLDLLQTCNRGPLRLLDNRATGSTGHHLVIRPRTDGPNTHAIGAVVRIEAGGLAQMRLITAGTSYLGQEPAEAFFGLGAATVVESVVIEWPGGGRTRLENVAADQVLELRKP